MPNSWTHTKRRVFIEHDVALTVTDPGGKTGHRRMSTATSGLRGPSRIRDW
jgi:hypothetical protein